MPNRTDTAVVNEKTLMKTFYDLLTYLASNGDCSLEEIGGYAVFSSGKGKGNLNYVVGLHDQINNENFQQLNDYYEAKGADSFVWFSYPYSQKLEHSLKIKGCEDIGPLTGVVHNLMHHISRPESPQGIVVQPVRTEFHFDQWCEVFTTVWRNHSFKAVSQLFRKFATNFDRRFTLFLATKNGVPVGCSGLDVNDDIGTCLWDGVLPDYRKQGIATTMLKHRLHYAWEKGCDYMAAQCLPVSLNVYVREGFVACCQMLAFKKKVLFK
jgi:GNAT superfamily N-acetyltransferase